MRRRTFLATVAGLSTSTAGCQDLNPLGGPREPLWQTSVGPHIVTPLAMAAGSLFATSGIRVARLAPDSGAADWTVETGDPDQFGLDADDDGVFAAHDGGRVVALGPGGDERWQSETLGEGVLNGITIDAARGQVIATTFDGTVVGVDRTSGKARWEFAPDGEIHRQAAVGEEAVYVASTDQHVYALDPPTGDERWAVDTGSNVTAVPTITDDAIYVGTTGGFVVSIDRTEGRERWRHEVGTMGSAPVVEDGVAYLSRSDRGLLALDIATKAKEWEFDDYAPATGPPAVGPNDVYVGGMREFNAVDRETGQHRWWAAVPNTGHVPPVLDDERVYVADGNGHVVAMELQ